jgi:hypothetical protein
MKANGIDRVRRRMNSFIRIFLLVIILILGFSGTEALPARAQSSPPAQPIASVALSPGDYVGTFQFDMRGIDVVSSTNMFLSTNTGANCLVDVSGTIHVQVTGPTTGTIIIDPTSYNIYAISDISGEGSGIKCKMMGYITGDATITFMSDLLNSYDPQTQSFISGLAITEWSKRDFRNTVISNHPACTQQVNEEQMTSRIQNFLDNINKNSVPGVHFYAVPYGETSLAGAVLNKSYERSITVRDGWVERTTSGHWSAYKQPIKPKGWKK